VWKPVLSLHARVSGIKQLPEGTAVGYDGTHVLRRDSTLALVSAGYLDGVPTTLGNNGWALINAAHAPVVGKVSMDFVMLDVTDIPGVKAGDRVTWIGRQGDQHITLGQLARRAGLYLWEVLGLIGTRVPRVTLAPKVVMDALNSAKEPTTAAKLGRQKLERTAGRKTTVAAETQAADENLYPAARLKANGGQAEVPAEADSVLAAE